MTSAAMLEKYTKCDAVISPCGLYRSILYREWAPPPVRYLVVIGLNPSTADGLQDDPTIRRCVGFAQREGLGGLIMANLYEFRATRPVDCERAVDPLGPNAH